MRELALLASVVICGVALFAPGIAIERRPRRPGIASGIAAGVMCIASVHSAVNRGWLLSGLFFIEGLVFAYEAGQRRRAARAGTTVMTSDEG